MNALEIRGLRKEYPGFTLDGLDLTLPGGCIMGLIGENGAGKSTIFRLLLGMARRDGGSIRILGLDSSDRPELLREDIGVVMDEVGLPDCLNVQQVGRIMQHTFRNWDDEVYSRLTAQLALPEGKPFKDFSLGMKRKLGIAVALSHHCRLLLLDEATSGLDPVVRDEVLELLMDFTRDEEHSVLISSHIVSDLEKLCDYVAFLHQGKLLLCQEKDRLLAEYGMFCGSAEELQALPPEALLYRRENAYGAEALVRRDALPAGLSVFPVSMEELFVCMVKEAQ